MNSTMKSLLAIASFGLQLSTPGSVQAEPCETPTAIRYSMVPLRDADLDQRLHQPLFKRITEVTGRPVEVVRATSYRSVVEGLLRGAIDMAELGPATYLEAAKGDPQITAFATMEKREGVYQIRGSHYQSMLTVLATSELRDVASLKGGSLALTDPGSTSGAQLPRKHFAAQVGMPLENYFGTVSYSGSHANSVLALAAGKVDAAFISSSQLEEANTAGRLRKRDVRVLWTSGPIPYDPVVYRGQLCDPLKRQLEAVLLGEGASVSLSDWLEAMNAVRFVPVEDSLYAGIREVLEAPAPAAR